MSNWTENKKSLTANPAYDPSLHNFHKGVIDNDPNEDNPANVILWRRLQELRKSNVNWGAIS